MLDDHWRKSSFSFSNGNCVEVRAGRGGEVQVRDTKDRGAGALVFAGPEWDAFVKGVKAGELGR